MRRPCAFLGRDLRTQSPPTIHSRVGHLPTGYTRSIAMLSTDAAAMFPQPPRQVFDKQSTGFSPRYPPALHTLSPASRMPEPDASGGDLVKIRFAPPLPASRLVHFIGLSEQRAMIAQNCARGVVAGGAGDAAAGMGTRAAMIEALQRPAIIGMAQHRPRRE
jgi:hypothetical protein